MRPIRRILVAVKDPTAKSLPAVMKGAQLARAFGAHLELFHGISTPLYVDTYPYIAAVPQIERRIRDDLTKKLETIASNLREQGLQVSVSVTWDFPVYEAIVRRARREKADLIVAERHAKPHIVPGLLRLTDWELLRTSPVPVLLVKNAEPYKRPTVLAAVDPLHALSKPATLDREILSVATGISRALRGPLHAVHAYVPMPQEQLPHRRVSDESLKKLTQQTERAARRRFYRSTQSAHIPKARCHLIGRHPIDAIEATARATRSSIVVMGAISRSGIKRFFFGNTAEALLDSLTCDMLIIKPAEFAARVPKRIRGVRFAATPFVPGY
jgi:universal stress protein E